MAENIETLPLDAMLKRSELANALTKSGFPISIPTLATMATRGGGPAFAKWGRYPLYRWGDALDWARARISKPVTSTSEIKARA